MKRIVILAMTRIWLPITWLLFTLSSAAQLSQQFETLFQSYFKKGLFEGSALIADSTGIVYHKSFGLANRDHSIPNSNETVFRMGSLEKQFTAMLVLQLAESGKLSLKGTVSDYLPRYRKNTGEKVTIEHLLTHTSGIPNYTALPNVWDDSLKLTYPANYIVQKFCSGNLEFTPGSKYKYSNTGYFLLAQIIQKVTGKPLAQVLKENILIPAGMNQTGLVDNITPIQHQALGYYRLASEYVLEPYIYVPNALGAASMYSTAFDLFLWDRILYTGKLLSTNYLKSYSSSHFSVAPGYAYGYGWEFTRTGIAPNDTIETMEHSGAIRAFRAVIFRVPKEKKCVILLSNCANQSSYDLFQNIMEIFRGIPSKEAKPLLADLLYSSMQKTSLENAIREFRHLKKSDSALYDYSRASLEFLGERLLLVRKFEQAIAIYKLAVEEDPTYTASYYYIGKAYENWGKVEEAINYYKMAVRNGKNTRAAVDAAFQIKYLESLR